MERNTFTTSLNIRAPQSAVVDYLRDAGNLGEWTLYSRMEQRIDDDTWLGTASGYARQLYYHVRTKKASEIAIVEYHCGLEHQQYFHVYPMLCLPMSYFGAPAESGTMFHWVSFVDPARRTPMIEAGLGTVHTAEAKSLKGHLERKQGLTASAPQPLSIEAHTIFVAADPKLMAEQLASPAFAEEWAYPLRRTDAGVVDEYGNLVKVSTRAHDLGQYHLIETDLDYGNGKVIRTPWLVFPCSFAFGESTAEGAILHRMSAWKPDGSPLAGELSKSDVLTQVINAKRILEANAKNAMSYERGPHYVPASKA